jgi:signal peptidase I
MAVEKKEAAPAKGKKGVIREWAESIIIALVLAMIIRALVVQAFKIPTGSMRMTLLEGDAILVNKFIFGARVPFTDIRLPALRQPQRGDIVVFISTEDKRKDFIKRLVAVAGQTVEIRNGTLIVDDQPVTDPVFASTYYYNCREGESACKYALRGQKITVPKDSYFVLGDNSASSQDSRYWGFVPKENMLGKAMVIYWPLNRIRILR